MIRVRDSRSIRGTTLVAFAAASLLVWAAGVAADMHTSHPFSGAKVNAGTVSHSREGGKSLLTLSSDFVPPETPDPHWQLVDSKGNVYLLNKLMIKGDKVNTRIEIPPYVKDVAKVQIYCSFAETVLGEAAFDAPVK